MRWLAVGVVLGLMLGLSQASAQVFPIRQIVGRTVAGVNVPIAVSVTGSVYVNAE